MKQFLKYPFAALLLFGAIVFLGLKFWNKPADRGETNDLPAVKNHILEVNTQFETQLKELISLVENKTETSELQKKFDELRMTYKKMEWAVEYFLPHSARFINGPALPEIEFAEHIVLEPEGLQVLEELIYDYDQESNPEIIRQLKKLQNKSGTIKTNFQNITLNSAQVFDALRQQVFRSSSLGIAGFDTPISGRHLQEIPVVLKSLKQIIQLLSDSPENYRILFAETDRAIGFLTKNTDKNTFDYATFLSDHLNRISTELMIFKEKAKIGNIEITSALRKDAATFYSKNAFDVDAFAPGEKFRISPEKINLGQKLFHDMSLSKDNNRSCASCHVPEKAFTDGLAKSMSLQNSELPRNTPSLNYASLQHGQFWDMRNEDLEGQSSEVITNKDEMHGDLEDIIGKIRKNPAYQKEFSKIYKTELAEVWQMQNVLASYIRSLAKFSSPFDVFMRGNKTAITSNQKQGFNLFVGKAKCATCHFIPIFNGTVPPNYSKTEQEVLGVAENAQNKKLDSDLGRGKFHETVNFLQHSFKTPTLRNVEKTAPYMHNGGYKTLEEVMHFYNEGGGKGLGLKVNNQTLPEDKLNLTPAEQEKIIDFMRALNDK